MREPARRRSSASSARSSSPSLLDISRHYPLSGRLGGVLATFFRAPSERTARRPGSASRRRRVLYFGNSSSSSVNSDLAYGNGYIPRPKRPSPPPVPTAGARSQQYQQHYQQEEQQQQQQQQQQQRRHQPRGGAGGTADSTSSRRAPRSTGTDDEILQIGRQLSDLAHRHSHRNLRAARSGGLAAAAAAGVDQLGRRKHRAGSASSRRRRHAPSSSDESDWESAWDESSDGAESALAYGPVVPQAIRPATAAASTVSGPSAYAGRSSVVDPRLFGPVNSLHGLVTPRPFSDDESAAPAVQYQHFNRLRRTETEPAHRAPMREVHPVSTSDPDRFDADTASSMLSRQEPQQARPAPVPLQQPVPNSPLPATVYQAEKLEDASRRDARHSRSRSDTRSFGRAVMAGVAAAALGSLAPGRKERKDDRGDDRRDDRGHDKREDRKKDRPEGREYREEKYDRDRRSEKSEKSDKDSRRRHRESDRDKERRRSKRDSYSKHSDDRDQRSSRYDESASQKRPEAAENYPEADSRGYRRGHVEVEVDSEGRSVISSSSRRDSRRYDERRDARAAEQTALERADDKDRRPPERVPIDPFQYQVDDSVYMTPRSAPAQSSAPSAVTVGREPTLDGSLPRVSTWPGRGDSFDTGRVAEAPDMGHRDAPRSAEPVRRRSFEEEELEAKAIYDEAKHATVPIAAAAVASAIAVERARSRKCRRAEYSDDGFEVRTREDAVQDEANRYYREAAIARKIAEGEARSHAREPERSVVDKWDEDTANETTIIATPPEVEDRRLEKVKSLYDAPDADVRIDNKIYPQEVHRFRSAAELDAPVFKSRDPSCERDRPVLNLIYPTPEPSRHASLSPDRPKSDQGAGQRGEPSPEAEPALDAASEPKDEAVPPSTPKSVTWGENSTKRFEVESPEPRSDTESPRDTIGGAEKPRPHLDTSSQWGIIAAAIAGSSDEPTNEPDMRGPDDGPPSEHKSCEMTAVGLGQIFTDTRDAPPVPGPKPASPEPGRMPGSFGDDVEFAATLAAGLEDSGFDPNIVIDDPTYRRRDSPPGESEHDGDGWHHKTFADGATDSTSRDAPGDGSVPEPGIAEAEAPKEEPVGALPADERVDLPAKLSKKEKKRLEKLKRQSAEASETVTTESSESPNLDEASDAPQGKRGQQAREREAQASLRDDEKPPLPESEPSQAGEADICEEHGRKRSKKDRSRDLGDASSKVSVPTDAFDDLQSLRRVDPDDEWAVPKKSRKSKRDSGVYATPSRSAERRVCAAASRCPE